jgi:hypothetical protein
MPHVEIGDLLQRPRPGASILASVSKENAMSHLVLLPSEPPADPLWLKRFTANLMRLRPGLATHDAMHHAILAHRATFLLDASEGAELWDEAMCARHPSWPKDVA